MLVVLVAVVTAGLLSAIDGLGSRDEHPAGRPAAQMVPPPGPAWPHRKAAPAAAAPAQPDARPATARIPLRRMVGAMVMARISGTSPSGGLLRRVRTGKVGGVILFPDNIGSAGQLRSMLSRLQHAARQSGSAGLLVAIDQEGGVVKRLPAGPPFRSAPSIGASGSSTLARREGAATGTYLSGLGINVDLAPVLDVAGPGSFIANRTFGSDPARVAKLGAAFAGGLGKSGVGATAKHFPGLGRATSNTDTSGSVVQAPLDLLRRDELPFQRVVADGIPLVMVSNAVYPAFGTQAPASMSKTIVSGELRGRLGFRGVVISDDLEAASIRRVASPGAAAVAAARAGVDIQLVASTPAASVAAYEGLLRAARRGDLSRSTIQASYDRIEALTRQVAAQP